MFTGLTTGTDGWRGAPGEQQTAINRDRARVSVVGLRARLFELYRRYHRVGSLGKTEAV